MKKSVRLALGLSISECWFDVTQKTAKVKEGIRTRIVDLSIGGKRSNIKKKQNERENDDLANWRKRRLASRRKHVKQAIISWVRLIQ